jgi:PilZ domain
MNVSADRFRPDRRLSPRYDVKTGVRVRIWKSLLPEQEVDSINLSERGILFATNVSLQKGEVVEILLNMPAEITGEPPVEWRCTGLIVRVEPFDSVRGNARVGVRFDCYEIARVPYKTQLEPTVSKSS